MILYTLLSLIILLLFVLLVIAAFFIGYHWRKPEQKKETEPETPDVPELSEDEKIKIEKEKKAILNFLNYDGSEQEEI